MALLKRSRADPARALFEPDPATVKKLLADKAKQSWAGQSQLLMRSNAEVLYQRLKYHQIDTFSP